MNEVSQSFLEIFQFSFSKTLKAGFFNIIFVFRYDFDSSTIKDSFCIEGLNTDITITISTGDISGLISNPSKTDLHEFIPNQCIRGEIYFNSMHQNH